MSYGHVMKEDNEALVWSLLAGATNLHVLRAFVVLGLADEMNVGPRALAELAASTGSDTGRLLRLLRAAEPLGLCSYHRHSDTWAITDAGGALTSDRAEAVRTWTLVMTSPWLQQAWSRLPDAVRGARDVFAEAHGSSFWDYLGTHEDAEALFDAAMAGGAGLRAQAASRVVSRLQPRTIVDVGGGDGSLLKSILDLHPDIRGVLAERAPVVHGAFDVVQHDRIEVVVTDFFDSVPPGGDLYLLSRVLHDHDDARSLDVLDSCRRVMTGESRLVILEAVVPKWEDLSMEDRIGFATKDLNMMVLVGGVERTRAEYERLLSAARFDLVEVDSSTPGVDVLLAARGVVDTDL